MRTSLDGIYLARVNITSATLIIGLLFNLVGLWMWAALPVNRISRREHIMYQICRWLIAIGMTMFTWSVAVYLFHSPPNPPPIQP